MRKKGYEHPRGSQIAAFLIAVGALVPVFAVASNSSAVTKAGQRDAAVLWRYPSDIERRDLFYGAGGRGHAPRSNTFRFVEEVASGSKLKLIVQDREGVKWIIKGGSEAQPEIAATRFVWATGYFTDEDYFLSRVVIRDVPSDLSRGGKYVKADGSMQDVRLERMTKKKVDKWKWRSNPFEDTRELNGLRVLMALLNNWDLKNTNNSIDESAASGRRPARTYVVADLGSTFGATRASWPAPVARGDPDKYRRSNFIVKTTPDEVHLATPRLMFVFYVIPFPDIPRWGKVKSRVPREDAKWIGELLARLSPAQVRAAFRGAGYSPADVELFSRVVESRIGDLNEL